MLFIKQWSEIKLVKCEYIVVGVVLAVSLQVFVAECRWEMLFFCVFVEIISWIESKQQQQQDLKVFVVNNFQISICVL